MRNRILIGLALAAAAAAATPALAQKTVEELTVTGRLTGEPPQTLSRVVSYADLDLRRTADQDTLRKRVHDTARDICHDLQQERPGPANLGKSCEERAVNDAMPKVKVAVADARARGGPRAAETAGKPASGPGW